MAELEELKKQNALSAVEYDQKVDSMSKSMMEWQKRLEIYALKFACINRDELDAMEKQAMELLDHGDVHGAIRLYEEMKLDSAMTLKIAVRQEAKEDMKLLLPSLVNNFQLLKQADDKVACVDGSHAAVYCDRIIQFCKLGLFRFVHQSCGVGMSEHLCELCVAYFCISVILPQFFLVQPLCFR